MPILGIIASANQQGRGGGPVGAYDSLATVTLSATTTSVTFSGIPSGYKHLQIRGISRCNTTNTYPDLMMVQFNSDTTAANYYSYHILTGDTSNASAYAAATTTIAGGMVGRTAGGSGVANTFSPFVIDILDYDSVNKFKTTRSLTGNEGQTSNLDNDITLVSSLWKSTSAVSSILLKVNNNTNSFVANSSFALYGVK